MAKHTNTTGKKRSHGSCRKTRKPNSKFNKPGVVR